MRATLKTLSMIFSYPDKDLVSLAEGREDLVKMLSQEDEETAKLIGEFLAALPLGDADVTYVSVFEAPAKCSLYAHEYLLRNKQEELGRFLLELKGIYRIHGVDVPLKKEIPDFLPVMLEFLALLYDVKPSEAARFARRYLKRWIPELRECLEKNNSPYSIAARALERALERVAATRQ